MADTDIDRTLRAKLPNCHEHIMVWSVAGKSKDTRGQKINTFPTKAGFWDTVLESLLGNSTEIRKDSNTVRGRGLIITNPKKKLAFLCRPRRPWVHLPGLVVVPRALCRGWHTIKGNLGGIDTMRIGRCQDRQVESL